MHCGGRYQEKLECINVPTKSLTIQTLEKFSQYPPLFHIKVTGHCPKKATVNEFNKYFKHFVKQVIGIQQELLFY